MKHPCCHNLMDMCMTTKRFEKITFKDSDETVIMFEEFKSDFLYNVMTNHRALKYQQKEELLFASNVQMWANSRIIK